MFQDELNDMFTDPEIRESFIEWLQDLKKRGE